MRKRLRKKRHVGEFRENGFFLAARYPDMDNEKSDAILYAFLDFIERRNLSGGGGFEFGMFISRLCPHGRCQSCEWRYGRDRMFGPVTDADREATVAWLRERGAVAEAGPLVDAWRASAAQMETATPTLEAA